MYERQLSASRGIELVPLLLAIFLSCAIPTSAAEDTAVDHSDIARALTRRVWLTVWPNHVYNDSTVRFRLNARFPEELQQRLIRLNEEGEWTMAFAWRLNIVKADSTSRVIRSVDLPIVRGDSEGSIDPSGLQDVSRPGKHRDARRVGSDDLAGSRSASQ